MFDRLEILSLARGMASHAGARQAILAENVANADTPGYRARDLKEFSAVYHTLEADDLRQTRPGHLKSDGQDLGAGRPVFDQVQADPNGNTVSIERELVRAADIRSDHNRALAIYGASLDILRAAIGRPR